MASVQQLHQQRQRQHQQQQQQANQIKCQCECPKQRRCQDMLSTTLSAGLVLHTSVRRRPERRRRRLFSFFLAPFFAHSSSITCVLNTVFSAAVCWLAATRYDQLILFDHELQSSYTRFASASAVAAASAAAAAFRCRLSFIVARTREEAREARRIETELTAMLVLVDCSWWTAPSPAVCLVGWQPSVVGNRAKQQGLFIITIIKVSVKRRRRRRRGRGLRQKGQYCCTE